MVRPEDDNREEEWSGQIWHQYDDRPVRYSTVVEMVQAMDVLYDRWDFPQRAAEARSFRPRRAVRKEGNKEENGEMKEERLQNHEGEKATFLVKVIYRQNSSWQGEVVWAEKNKKERFRSALELLKLMDSALNEEDE